MIKEITSKDNKIYKHAKKLLDRTERYKTGMYIAEGARIVKDAVESQVADHLFVSEDYCGELWGLPTYKISKKMFSALSDTETTQGIIAVCKMQKAEISKISGNTLLVCDGVSDPGNMGTLIRTAECSGADGIVILKGCVDPYSPKAVRSTMGSLFRLPVYFAEYEDVKNNLSNYTLAVTMLEGSEELYNIKFPKKVAIVVGNEARGVSDAFAEMADVRLRIPMYGNAESLNAAVAGSVVMYEILRQKREESC